MQANILTKLKQLSVNNLLPHAILLSDPDAAITADLCQQFAQYLLCIAKIKVDNTLAACGQCKSCILFAAGTHLDFLSIAPSESGTTHTIKIEAVREVVNFVSIQAQFSTYKVVVITGVQYLNTHAVNALLKTLEEPPPRTILLLTTINHNLLLPTFLSRCTVFALKSQDYGHNALVQHLELDLQELLVKKTTQVIAIAAKWSKYKAIEVADGLWLILYGMVRDLSIGKSVNLLAPGQHFSVLWPILEQVTKIKELLCAGRPVNIQLCLEALLIDWRNKANVG